MNTTDCSHMAVKRKCSSNCRVWHFLKHTLTLQKEENFVGSIICMTFLGKNQELE